MNFDLADLRAFVAVADLGSFKAAAGSLHLSQPALSRRVGKLEAAIGHRLLERTTRRVELSAIGRGFLPKARHVLNELEGSLLGIAEVADRLQGQVSVACVPSTVGHVIAGAVKTFHRRFPRIRVRLIDVSAVDILLAVSRAEADFGVSYLGAHEPDLEFEPLFHEDFVVACLHDHPLARRRKVTWAELAGHESVALAPGSGNRMLIDQALSGLPLRMNWACEVRHVPALISLVEAGIGIGAVPRFALSATQRERLRIVPLVEPEVARTIGIVSRRGRPLPPAASAFHALLTQSRKPGGRHG